jgi:hypothetical protein
MSKLYRLDIDNVLSSLSLFTEHDVGGEGHAIVVEKENLHKAIAEIADNFYNLIEDSFELDEEEDEEEGDEE